MDFINCSVDGVKVIELQSGFNSLVATKPFKSGEVLTPLSLEPRSEAPNRYTLQIDDNLHGEPMPFEFRFVNHSCAPNAAFDVDRMVVIALKDIQVNDPITAFYPSTEWHMQEPFACLCGAVCCLEQIAGANTMSNDTLSRYTLSNCIRKKVEARKGEVEQSVRRLSATIADNIVENNNDAVKSDVVVGVGADKRHIIKVNE